MSAAFQHLTDTINKYKVLLADGGIILNQYREEDVLALARWLIGTYGQFDDYRVDDFKKYVEELKADIILKLRQNNLILDPVIMLQLEKDLMLVQSEVISSINPADVKVSLKD